MPEDVFLEDCSHLSHFLISHCWLREIHRKHDVLVHLPMALWVWVLMGPLSPHNLTSIMLPGCRLHILESDSTIIVVYIYYIYRPVACNVDIATLLNTWSQKDNFMGTCSTTFGHQSQFHAKHFTKHDKHFQKLSRAIYLAIVKKHLEPRQHRYLPIVCSCCQFQNLMHSFIYELCGLWYINNLWWGEELYVVISHLPTLLPMSFRKSLLPRTWLLAATLKSKEFCQEKKGGESKWWTKSLTSRETMSKHLWWIHYNPI